jgi:hypothetical protein
MRVGEETPALGHFVATSAPRVGPAAMAKLGWGTLAAFLGLIVAMIVITSALGRYADTHPQQVTNVAMTVFATFAIGQFVFFMLFHIWNRRGKMRIAVTSDGLTANQRPGAVYSAGDATLGPWVASEFSLRTVGGVTLGTALHLRCGPKNLVLGGRDHRLAMGARLEAPPTERVDAWMWAADFDRLLAMIGSRSRLDVRGPAPGEPIRCLLLTNPMLLTRRQRNSNRQPVLAVDVGNDQIRVIDPNGNVPVASAWLTQATATPADCVVRMSKVQTVKPVLVIRIPGLSPLTITCHDEYDPFGLFKFGSRQIHPRFTWHNNNESSDREPDFVVSGADWLTLVKTFGFAWDLSDMTARTRDKAARGQG